MINLSIENKTTEKDISLGQVRFRAIYKSSHTADEDKEIRYVLRSCIRRNMVGEYGLDDDQTINGVLCQVNEYKRHTCDPIGEEFYTIEITCAPRGYKDIRHALIQWLEDTKSLEEAFLTQRSEAQDFECNEDID